MAAVTTELKVLVKVAGDKGLDKLSRSLQNIGKQAQSSSVRFDQVAKRLQQVQRNSSNSISSLRNYRNAWRDIAEQVDISSKEFRQATAEAKRLDAQLQKAQGRRTGGQGRFGRAAQITGTIAGAGVFGGIEGGLGAALGAFGGPQGAIVGGAIGAQVGQLRKALGATAEYAASLEKLRVALLGVTTSQEEYGDALSFISQTTKTFAIPQDIVTRQFTKLQASVQGAGGNLEDTKTAFNGIVAAVRATGGSLADVDAALTATAQVFSKGKVSAEELRQQIGERLPGAFTLFAESIGLTPAELDKALEGGKVSLQDFQTFAEAIFERYGKTAQEIANGPESAGDRLQVKLQELNEAVGRLLAPIGAEFQRVFTDITDLLIKAANALDRFFGISDDAVVQKNTVLIQAANRQLVGLRKTLKGFQQEITEKGDPLGIRKGLVEETQRTIEEIERKRAKLRAEINRATSGQQRDIAQPTAGTGLGGGGDLSIDTGGKIREITREQLELTRQINQAKLNGQGLQVAELEYARTLLTIEQERIGPNLRLEKQEQALFRLRQEQIKIGREAGEAMAKSVIEDAKKTDKLKKAIDAFNKSLAEMIPAVTPIEQLFKDIGQSITTNVAGAIENVIFEAQTLQESLSGILRSVASLLIQFGTKSIAGGLFPNLFENAYGNVVDQNKIVPFARGGLVNKPTLFPMANGMGLMGEAGPEAIMPLRRGANGRLGVESSGGMGNVVVNVDATGTSVQGDDQQAGQLGRAIGAAVQAELVKQKRPGGLLAG
jgi:tape measure domain-containing protein